MMNEERYPIHDGKSAPKMRAKVILAKCPYARSKSENLFGMRVQNIGGDWKRTWAFKIDAERAHHEGYDKERANGTFSPTADYPGCPYCHTLSLAQCSCGKSFCMRTEGERQSNVLRLTCPWCGLTGEYHTTEVLDLQGGGI